MCFFSLPLSFFHLLCLGDINEAYTPTLRIFFSVSPNVTAHIKCLIVNRTSNEFNQTWTSENI